MEISSLSSWDIIMLKANFDHVYVLKCEELIEQHVLKHGYTYEVASKTVFDKHSCNKMHDEAIYQIDNLKFHTCPCNYKHPYFGFISQAAAIYETGNMPFEGSFIDQPAVIIEAINLFQNMKQSYIEEQSKKQKPKKGK